MFALVVASAPGIAEAGRTQYGWLFGTEVLPERGAEMITWIDEQNDREPNDIHWTRWGWSGLVGVTEQAAGLMVYFSLAGAAVGALVYWLHNSPAPDWVHSANAYDRLPTTPPPAPKMR